MGESETPWALVTRLRANGSTIEQIVAALKEQRLSREDIDLLLQDDDAYRAWTRAGLLSLSQHPLRRAPLSRRQTSRESFAG